MRDQLGEAKQGPRLIIRGPVQSKRLWVGMHDPVAFVHAQRYIGRPAGGILNYLQGDGTRPERKWGSKCKEAEIVGDRLEWASLHAPIALRQRYRAVGLPP